MISDNIRPIGAEIFYIFETAIKYERCKITALTDKIYGNEREQTF
jgi:hypothetical protein